MISPHLCLSIVVTIIAMAVIDAAVPPLLPKQATDDTPWEDLRALLNDPTTLSSTTTNPTVWQEQCVQIFEDITQFPGVDGTFSIVSNYLTMNQPSGLCLDHVSCAYEYCMWPPQQSTFPNYPIDVSPFVIQSGNTVDLLSDVEEDPLLLLPDMVLQPTNV